MDRKNKKNKHTQRRRMPYNTLKGSIRGDLGRFFFGGKKYFDYAHTK
jgi:hypothetical protein